jgi:hypothetical protein
MSKLKQYKTITLKLQGEKITAEKLRSSIGAFYGFVDEVASQVSGVKKPIKWIVTIKKGSIILTNEPELIENLSPQVQRNIFENIQKGIDTLKKEAERPPFYTDRALEYLETLASIPHGRGNGLTGIDISIDRDKYPLTKEVLAHVDSLLGVYSKALGSIEGKLQTLSERGGLKFIVYDALTDKGVRCYVAEELMPDATRAFGKRVYVYGMIHYDNKGNPKTIKVEELRIFEEEKKIPTALEICGILMEQHGLGT